MTEPVAVRDTMGILHPHTQTHQPLVTLIFCQLPLGQGPQHQLGWWCQPWCHSSRSCDTAPRLPAQWWPLAKHLEHTVKCVLPVSKVTAQGKGAGGAGSEARGS